MPERGAGLSAAAPTTPATPWGAYACLAGSMALVGSYVGLSKLLVAVLPVFLLAWLRFGMAAVAMAHWVPRRGGEPALNPGQRKLLFWESFLGNFLFSICMLYGVALTSAVAAGITMAGIPATVALLSRVFLGERLNRRVLSAIACAAGGMALLAWARNHGLADDAAGPATPGAPPPGAAGQPAAASSAPLPWLPAAWRPLVGQALLVSAVLCEASYVVIGKRLTTGGVSPRRISALINLWGLALVTPLGLWQALQFDFAAVPAATWVLLAFYAIAASMVTVWLWMKGLRRVPAQRAGVFTVLLPISAAAVGVLALGEVFSPLHALALGLALGGLLLATWPERQAPAAGALQPGSAPAR